MNENVGNFIESNIELIDKNNFEELYELSIKKLRISEIHELTEILLRADIDPLLHLTFVPQYYLAGSSYSEIAIPSHITRIAGSAFAHSKIEHMDLSKSNITTIAPSAFRECSHLTSFKFPNRCTDIGSGCLSECDALIEVVLPNNGTSYIPGLCFSACHELKEIYLPDNITKIGIKAFHQCHSSLKIYINKSRASELQVPSDDKWLYDRALVEI